MYFVAVSGVWWRHPSGSDVSCGGFDRDLRFEQPGEPNAGGQLHHRGSALLESKPNGQCDVRQLRDPVHV